MITEATDIGAPHNTNTTATCDLITCQPQLASKQPTRSALDSTANANKQVTNLSPAALHSNYTMPIRFASHHTDKQHMHGAAASLNLLVMHGHSSIKTWLFP